MNTQKTYFVENKEITEQVNKIKRIIRGSMNGITVESMTQKGIHYKANFGVALPRLREIASQYEPNMQLATQLWFLEMRESMIIGSLLVPQGEMDTNTAITWCEKIPNHELSEITAMTLFCRQPNASQFVAKALENTNPLVVTTAISTATRITKELPDTLIKEMVLQFNTFEQLTLVQVNTLATCLARVASDNTQRIGLIEELIQPFSASENRYHQYIFEYVTKELEYLKQI
ncbi:MAG: hypothetical protein PHI42_04025 [Paludibacteraceae bacterium]|nr:hypothetical protein [Paludibacteraceae bacterium]